MSVFKAREWWATQCGDGDKEELGPGCMVVGNLDNEPGGNAKLVMLRTSPIGSHMQSHLSLHEDRRCVYTAL